MVNGVKGWRKGRKLGSSRGLHEESGLMTNEDS